MIKRLSDRFWNYLTDRIEARMDLRPDRDNTLDLGSSDYQWRRVYVGPGSATAPALVFDGDTNTGIYQSAADNLDFAVGGAHLLRLKGTGAEVGIEDSSAGYIGAHGGGTGGHEGGELQLHMAADHDGTYDFWFIDVYDDDLRFGPTGAVYLMLRPENTAAAPLMAFKNDLDTGIYQSAADNLDFATGGARRVNISNTGLSVTGSIRGSTPIGARVYNSSDISISSGVWTALTFNAERFDTDGIHSTTTNTSRLTCVTAGTYLIIGQAMFQANATGARGLGIWLNGNTPLAYTRVPSTDATSRPIIEVTTIYQLAANNYVELFARQDSGGALDVDADANHSPEFMMVRIA